MGGPGWEKTPHSCSQWETSANSIPAQEQAPQIPSAKACVLLSPHTPLDAVWKPTGESPAQLLALVPPFLLWWAWLYLISFANIAWTVKALLLSPLPIKF